MDPDFMREMLVLLFFIGLYLVVSAVFLRGHHTDLSEVTAHNAKAGVDSAGANAGPRLNRRRKAIAREAAGKIAKSDGTAEMGEE